MEAFTAIADPVRRGIVDRLAEGEKSAGELRRGLWNQPTGRFEASPSTTGGWSCRGKSTGPTPRVSIEPGAAGESGLLARALQAALGRPHRFIAVACGGRAGGDKRHRNWHTIPRRDTSK